MLYLGTLQAFWFTSFYVTGCVLCLGVNPIEEFRFHKRQMQEELDLIAQNEIDMQGRIDQIGFSKQDEDALKNKGLLEDS